jgi:hypothetical protein
VRVTFKWRVPENTPSTVAALDSWPAPMALVALRRDDNESR